MVTVPRIAVVSCLSTTPFIYGIQHEGNLRAELLLSDPSEILRLFSDRRADLALIPASAYPTLNGARIVTEYCVLWVAAPEVDPETVEALQHALTYGLEHGYEAILESPYGDDPGRAYEGLSRFDYIFDNQKDKALKKFWDSGQKVAPRSNPG